MRYFPIFMDLKDRHVVVVGGAEEAARKVRLLLKTEAKISVIAPVLHDELAASPRINWLAKTYAPALLDGAALVYSADPDLNTIVSADAQARGIPVNAVDDAGISTFIVPSIVDRDPVVIAIGTEGAAPVLAQGIRARIDQMLPQSLGRLADRARALREYVAAELKPGNSRRSFWHEFFFGEPRAALESGDAVAFDLALHDAIHVAAGRPEKESRGRVSLVGAGPGDAELLTIKAHRRIQEADVIVYDRLVSPEVLEMARRDALRIPVGKTPFEASPRQSEINAILVREALKGQHVVRLKGGDPYIFGRGAEEQAALEAEGIAVDVVPGITAALGCAASARLPLTQRGQNRAITLLTASGENGFAEHDWQALARQGSVFAVYMGVNCAGDMVSRLLDAGMEPTTPATIVENGTLASERIFTTTIGSLWQTLNENGVAGPAIIYVGLAAARPMAEVVAFPVREDIRQAVLRAAS